MIGMEDVSKISFHESRAHNNTTPPDQMSPIHHNQNFDKKNSNNFIHNGLQQLESEPKLRKKNTTLKFVPEVKRSIDKEDVKRSAEDIQYDPNSPSRVRGAV